MPYCDLMLLSPLEGPSADVGPPSIRTLINKLQRNGRSFVIKLVEIKLLKTKRETILPNTVFYSSCNKNNVHCGPI